MLVYKDIISGDELCSDSYPMQEVDDIVYEFDGKRITVGFGISDELIGGNASQEEAGETAEDAQETVINIVHAHQLKETSFDKKGYTTYIKGYMKKILSKLEATNPERAAIFKVKAAEYVKKVLKNIDNYSFYTGERMDPDAMVILCDYREDQITPFFILFKDGLEEEKC